MDIQEYSDRQLRLISDLGSEKANLAHMAMGVAGEAGEVLDIVKKHFAYGKRLDDIHLIEEIGDCVFYISGLIHMIDSSWDEVLRVNVAKLEARYPNLRFDANHAINRDKEAEAKAMEGV